MTIQITATVVNGMLKPDEQLLLADHTRVHLTVEPIVEKVEPAAAWASLEARLRKRPIHGGGIHFTRDQLHERR